MSRNGVYTPSAWTRPHALMMTGEKGQKNMTKTQQKLLKRAMLDITATECSLIAIQKTSTDDALYDKLEDILTTLSTAFYKIADLREEKTN